MGSHWDVTREDMAALVRAEAEHSYLMRCWCQAYPPDHLMDDAERNVAAARKRADDLKAAILEKAGPGVELNWHGMTACLERPETAFAKRKILMRLAYEELAGACLVGG